MKLSLSILLGLVGAAATASAGPILYNINFTTASGIAPTSGSFLYDDAAANPFASFLVVWNGITFDLTAAANDPILSNGCDPATPGTATGHDSFAALFTVGTPCTGPREWRAVKAAPTVVGFYDNVQNGSDPALSVTGVAPAIPGSQVFFANGGFSALAAVPEPSQAWPMLGGGVLLAVWRRRNSPMPSRSIQE